MRMLFSRLIAYSAPLLLAAAVHVATAQEPAPLTTQSLRGLVFSPDSQLLAGVVEEVGAISDLVVWNVAAKEERLIASLPTGERFTGATAFTPDGRLLASAVSDGSIRFWNTSTWAEAQRIVMPDTMTGRRGAPRARRIAFSSDGKLLAVGANEQWKLNVWDLSSNRVQVDRVLPGAANSAVFTPDSQRIVLGLSSRRKNIPSQVQIWTLAALGNEKGKAERTFPGVHGIVLIAVAADGRQVAMSFDEKLWLHDMASGRSVSLGSHANGLMGLAFSPDSRWLATAGAKMPYGDGPETLKIWDLSTGRALALSNQPRACGMNGLAFSPDGRFLATSLYRRSDGPRVYLWTLPPESTSKTNER